jgi:hypothetical protein
LPLNTISMGQTQPQKQTGSGQYWAFVGSVGGDLQPGSLRRLCNQGLRQSTSGSCLAQPGRARILDVVGTLGGRWVGPLPLHGGRRSIQHSRCAQRAGGSTALHPVKRVWGSMPGSCAGDGGCSGGRQRLPIGLARVKAGRQRLGRHCSFQGGGGALKQGLPAFGEGVVAFQKSNK